MRFKLAAGLGEPWTLDGGIPQECPLSMMFIVAWFSTALDIEEVLAGAVDTHVHIFVADVVKSFETVDRSILDRVLSSLGLLAWFRHALF